jgi:hypothetical protein
MNTRAHKSFSPSEVKVRLYSWPAAFIGLLLVKGALSVTPNSGIGVVRFGTIVYFLLLLLGIVFAIRNAVGQHEGTRLFWALMACGYGFWVLDQWLYLYYVIGLGTDVPDSSIADPALFLHVVPFMAALAMQPHLNRSNQRLSRASLNFFLLLFFWVFLYAYFLFPHQYLWTSDKYGVRFDILYSIENITLVLAAAVATARAKHVEIHLPAITRRGGPVCPEFHTCQLRYRYRTAVQRERVLACTNRCCLLVCLVAVAGKSIVIDGGNPKPLRCQPHGSDFAIGDAGRAGHSADRHLGGIPSGSTPRHAFISPCGRPGFDCSSRGVCLRKRTSHKKGTGG